MLQIAVQLAMTHNTMLTASHLCAPTLCSRHEDGSTARTKTVTNVHHCYSMGHLRLMGAVLLPQVHTTDTDAGSCEHKVSQVVCSVHKRLYSTAAKPLDRVYTLVANTVHLAKSIATTGWHQWHRYSVSCFNSLQHVYESSSAPAQDFNCKHWQCR
jgi:hypothetical protein